MDVDEYTKGSESFDFVEQKLGIKLRAWCRVLVNSADPEPLIEDIKKLSQAIDLISDAHMEFLDRNKS